MGVLFMDSFDHSDVKPGKWTAVGSYNNWDLRYNGGRFSSYCARITWYDTATYLSKTLTSGVTTIYVGTAFFFGSPNAIAIIWFGDASAAQCGVCVQGDGTLFAIRGNFNGGTGIGSPSTLSISAGVWNYITIKVKIGDSDGEFLVKVNGVTFLNLTGVDTRNSGPTISGVALTHPTWSSYGCDVRWDDFWIADDQDYGDCRIECISPTGAGNYAQWTPSAGNNWDCVEEKPPSTSEFISSATAGQIDTYATGNVTPTTGTVVAVAGNFYAQKSDAGSRSIALATRLSSTDDVGATLALPSSWAYLQDIKATKPGGGAWTISDVNDAEFGVKMIA